MPHTSSSLPPPPLASPPHLEHLDEGDREVEVGRVAHPQRDGVACANGHDGPAGVGGGGARAWVGAGRQQGRQRRWRHCCRAGCLVAAAVAAATHFMYVSRSMAMPCTRPDLTSPMASAAQKNMCLQRVRAGGWGCSGGGRGWRGAVGGGRGGWPRQHQGGGARGQGSSREERGMQHNQTPVGSPHARPRARTTWSA